MPSSNRDINLLNLLIPILSFESKYIKSYHCFHDFGCIWATFRRVTRGIRKATSPNLYISFRPFVNNVDLVCSLI